MYDVVAESRLALAQIWRSAKFCSSAPDLAANRVKLLHLCVKLLLRFQERLGRYSVGWSNGASIACRQKWDQGALILVELYQLATFSL